ncbi:MAG: hypothetical protein MUC43_18085 [Pirellula sp.]|jgi:hypothetical protein|nr:hypothetical protein [Pirellula sp.]
MSHTFEALSALEIEPTSECVDTAEMVRWTHVFRSTNAMKAITQFLRTGRIVVPESRNESTTCKSEMKLGLDPSIYLYAGRVFPSDLAQAAFLVTHQSLIEGRNVGDVFVAPFDTGAIAQNHSTLPFDVDHPGQYVQEHSTTAENFQHYFSRFLDRYFASVSDYWAGIPEPIDGTVFNGSSDFRNWTFEVRCRGFAELSNSHWVVDDDIFGVLNRAILTPGAGIWSITLQKSVDSVASDAEDFSRNLTI